jgi:hypothetical protein
MRPICSSSILTCGGGARGGAEAAARGVRGARSACRLAAGWAAHVEEDPVAAGRARRRRQRATERGGQARRCQAGQELPPVGLGLSCCAGGGRLGGAAGLGAGPRRVRRRRAAGPLRPVRERPGGRAASIAETGREAALGSAAGSAGVSGASDVSDCHGRWLVQRREGRSFARADAGAQRAASSERGPGARRARQRVF